MIVEDQREEGQVSGVLDGTGSGNPGPAAAEPLTGASRRRAALLTAC
ncbi:hypothetical protein [Saccharopolyspora hordei]|uniref:Uncharacterized protein n=1 Tax=Saccharopolyspora hordei TaxID=1838 RepID=A0A853AP72_9PSEU|nr:hypothetical protein [Saccharopolyspora hordei]NYI81947.1 hypothetical protein [Saccharopolyspora hordei]